MNNNNNNINFNIIKKLEDAKVDFKNLDYYKLHLLKYWASCIYNNQYKFSTKKKEEIINILLNIYNLYKSL